MIRAAAALVGVVTVVSACAYYNTIYNAERLYEEAEGHRQALALGQCIGGCAVLHGAPRPGQLLGCLLHAPGWRGHDVGHHTALLIPRRDDLVGGHLTSAPVTQGIA